MDKRLAMILSAGIGAGWMYFWDRQLGNRRRALMRDKFVRLAHQADHALDVTRRDLMNRTCGIWAELRSSFTQDEVSDEVLVDRVRAEIGGVVAHPRAIEVSAERGRVTLHGQIFTDQVDKLLRRVASVRGVRDVENRLQAYKDADNVPSLQGQPARRLSGHRMDVLQTYWSPTTRMLAGAAGGALAVYGVGRRDVGGTTLSIMGLTLLARALTNIEMKRLLGVGVGRRAIDIQKTITINAPVERVFQLWSNYKNFPYFMSNVRDVRDLGNGRSHWIVAGLLGTTVEWDAVLTSYVPNEVLAWRTEPNSVIQHAGIIRFEASPDGGTRVNIHLTYNPGVGGLGHAFATLFGADPKSQMDEDLVRMKTFIEAGKVPSDAAAAHRS